MNVVDEFSRALAAGGDVPSTADQYQELNEEWKSAIAQNANGYRVLIFSGYFGAAATPFTYHFHFLLSSYMGEPVAVCLDTGESVPLTQENPGAREFEEMSRLLLTTFGRKISFLSLNPENLSAKTMFRRAEPVLWEKFNSLKEESFIDYIRSQSKTAGPDREFVLKVVLDESKIPEAAAV